MSVYHTVYTGVCGIAEVECECVCVCVVLHSSFSSTRVNQVLLTSKRPTRDLALAQ